MLLVVVRLAGAGLEGSREERRAHKLVIGVLVPQLAGQLPGVTAVVAWTEMAADASGT